MVVKLPLKREMWLLETIQIRDFALAKHYSVDDTLAGRGTGMVMWVDALAAALDSFPYDFQDC